MNSTSTPATAAMASALRTASGLSSITMVRISALIAACASAWRAAGSRRPRGGPPQLRWPIGRIMERVGDPLGVGRGIDMRHDDTQRAVVQRPCRLIHRAGANAHDRRDAGRQGGDAKLRGFLDGERAMLAVDEHPVVAGRGGQHGRGDGSQVMHAEAQGHFAGFEALAWWC